MRDRSARPVTVAGFREAVPWIVAAAVAGGSFLLTWTGLGAAWSDPEADWPQVLTFAASLPSLAAVIVGAWLWCRGKAWTAARLGRACFVFTAGTLAALLVMSIALASIDVGTPVERWSQCGPFRSVCASFVGLHVANMMAVLTLGLAFPALFPFAAAGLSMLLPAGAPPGRAHMALAVFAVALTTGLAVMAGLAIGEA